MKQQTFTHSEVESILRRILNQDSRGNIAWEANKVAREYDFDLSEKNEEVDPDCDFDYGLDE